MGRKLLNDHISAKKEGGKTLTGMYGYKVSERTTIWRYFENHPKFVYAYLLQCLVTRWSSVSSFLPEIRSFNNFLPIVNNKLYTILPTIASILLLQIRSNYPIAELMALLRSVKRCNHIPVSRKQVVMNNKSTTWENRMKGRSCHQQLFLLV